MDRAGLCLTNASSQGWFWGDSLGENLNVVMLYGMLIIECCDNFILTTFKMLPNLRQLKSSNGHTPSPDSLYGFCSTFHNNHSNLRLHTAVHTLV